MCIEIIQENQIVVWIYNNKYSNESINRNGGDVMKIIDIDDFGSKVVNFDLVVEDNNILYANAQQLSFDTLCKHEGAILKVLNSINNQGISKIDFSKREYELGNRVLSFLQMGTAEQLFLISYYAVTNKKSLSVKCAFKNLREDVLDVYINWLKEIDTDNCVTLVTVDFSDVFLLRQYGGDMEC